MQSQAVKVRRFFSAIAPTYDRNNALCSLGLHRLWNRALVGALDGCQHLLDLCAGTGTISWTLLRRQEPQAITLLDFCSEMLEVAKERAPETATELHYLQADAMEIPLAAESVDAVSCAYGIRNVVDPVQCGREVHRILKPGGRFAILELTRPKSWLLGLGHRLYLATLLPLVGRLCSPDRAAYAHLRSSVGAFVTPEELATQMEGFEVEEIRPLSFGAATLLLLRKPPL